MLGGVTYVVVSDRPVSYHKGLFTFLGWAVIPVKDITGETISITTRQYAAENQEVDQFFPGNVFELPDYIK